MRTHIADADKGNPEKLKDIKGALHPLKIKKNDGFYLLSALAKTNL
jgi:hypothetical protein